MAQDWAYLLDDMIILISEKASTIVQYMRLRAVCKDWRRVLTASPCHLPPQAPWLMFPRRADFANFVDPFLSFYDLSESRTHRFELPSRLRSSFIHGSSYGWLVLEHNNIMQLYNPINNMDISDFPSLRNPISEIEGSNLWILKVVLSCNPSNTEGCVVVAGFRSPSTWELGFCRIGDHQWTILKMRNASPLLDFTFHNNSVYTTDREKRITVYDLQNHAVRTFPFGFEYDILHHQINLAEGSAGFLLVRTSFEYMSEVNAIHVFLWKDELQKWQQVTNITDRQIFLSTTQCCALQLEEHQGNILHYAVLGNSNNSYSVSINRVNLENEIFVATVLLDPIQIFNIISGLSSWFTPSFM